MPLKRTQRYLRVQNTMLEFIGLIPLFHGTKVTALRSSKMNSKTWGNLRSFLLVHLGEVCYILREASFVASSYGKRPRVSYR